MITLERWVTDRGAIQILGSRLPSCVQGLEMHPVKKADSLDRMEAELREKLQECARHINTNHKVASLCLSFPDRISKLKGAKGERLRG